MGHVPHNFALVLSLQQTSTNAMWEHTRASNRIYDFKFAEALIRQLGPTIALCVTWWEQWSIDSVHREKCSRSKDVCVHPWKHNLDHHWLSHKTKSAVLHCNQLVALAVNYWCEISGWQQLISGRPKSSNPETRSHPHPHPYTHTSTMSGDYLHCKYTKQQCTQFVSL